MSFLLTLFLTIDMSAYLSMVPTLSVNTVKELCQAVGPQAMPYYWLMQLSVLLACDIVTKMTTHIHIVGGEYLPIM